MQFQTLRESPDRRVPRVHRGPRAPKATPVRRARRESRDRKAPKVPPEPTATPPQRGVDYWTEADKQQMVQDVINALPVYNGEVE